MSVLTLTWALPRVAVPMVVEPLPTALAHRLRRLRDEMQRAYTEGRLDVPTEHGERIPLWYVIESALNEVEQRCVRSGRPRPKRAQLQPQHQENPA
jgi:hypothetical protein